MSKDTKLIYLFERYGDYLLLFKICLFGYLKKKEEHQYVI